MEELEQQEIARVYRNRPTFWGMIVRPRQQMKMALVFMIAAWVAIELLALVIAVNLEDITGLEIAIYSFIAGTALSVFAVVAGIVMTHRVFGPFISINRHIARLREGEYSARLQLRHTDDLTEIKDSLNELAAALEARHGAGRRNPS